MYKKSLKTISVIAIVTILNGCASFTHYNKERELSEDSAVFIDAKQRGIYKAKRTETTGKDAGKVIVTWEGVCAEPSPDAISSLAATLGVDLSLTDKGNLGVSQSLAEGVSSIGIRTAAIEALRDIMYRNCEAYALGGVSSIGLETLQRRFQSTMVAILAIEQLTGAARAPATIIVSESSAGSPDAIVDLTNKTEAARISLNSAKESESKSKSSFEKSTKEKEDTEKKIADGKAEADKIRALPTPSEEEKKKLTEYDALTTTQLVNKADEESAKKEYETAQSTTKEREQALKALDASRVAALTGGGSASTSAKIETLSAKPALSDAATKEIATAVVGIVKAATSGLNYTSEVCVTLIGQNANVAPVDGSPLAVCRDLLSAGKIKLMNNAGAQ